MNLINLAIKSLLLTVYLLCYSSVYSQNENSLIDNDNFNERYLEYLIKIKIDSVRKLYNCKPLVNDSILYVASKHHADYMLKANKLTHDESSAKTKTPQLRAEFYGAKNYLVGENVILSSYNVDIKNKKGKTLPTNTYGELAYSLVDGWVNSPGHFKNIITPDYNITGLSITVDKKNNVVYSCQKFAKKLYQYTFYETKSMFPYSEYVPEPIISSFNGINNQLLSHKHEWGLKHDDLEKCNECLILTKDAPPYTLRVENGSFILKFENSEYVKQLINDKNDGFAVEIVYFDDYMCGNPDYYKKPSRRNGQCKLNGTLLNPLYRNELYKGYKKRKVDKEIKFLSYILKSDSIPFFKRFYSYKLHKFSSAYYEINVGKTPKNGGLWSHNLIYIQDKQICDVDYFTDYCGETYFDTLDAALPIFDTTAYYRFKPDTTSLFFEIPFKKNDYTFTKEDISPFLNSFKSQVYKIDSILIKAYSSVEGDSLANDQLQIKRAQSIVDILQKNQTETIKTNIQTFSSWDHFYKSLRTSKKWNFLSKLNKNDLLKKINGTYSDSLEFILEKERKAQIKMYCSIDTVDRNLQYFIIKEYNSLIDSVDKWKRDETKTKFFINKLHILFSYSYRLVHSSKVDTAIFEKLLLPDNADLSFCEKFMLYSYEFPKVFRNNKTWLSRALSIESAIVKEGINKASDEFIYCYSNNKIEHFNKGKVVSKNEIQSVIDNLELLKYKYESSSFYETNIDKLNYNLNMNLLSKSFLIDMKANASEAEKAINHLFAYYTKNNKLNDTVALKLAKFAVKYDNVFLAIKILEPFKNNETVMAYLVPLYYQHSSTEGSEDYYNLLLSLSKSMTPEVWCNMFISQCKLPFQAFDHEALRNVFCEKCMQLNNFTKELTK